MPPPIVADTDLPADTDWCDSDDGSDGGGGGCAAAPRPPRGGVSGNEGASKGCTRCNIVATKRRHPRLPSHRLLRSPFGIPIESSSRFSCQFNNLPNFLSLFPLEAMFFYFPFFFWSSLFLVLRRTVFIRLYRVFFGWLEKLIGKNTGGFVPRDWGTDRFGSQFKHHLFYCTWRMVVRFLILNRNISYTLDASLILCILDKEVNTIFFLRQREVCPGEKNNPS